MSQLRFANCDAIPVISIPAHKLSNSITGFLALSSSLNCSNYLAQTHGTRESIKRFTSHENLKHQQLRNAVYGSQQLPLVTTSRGKSCNSDDNRNFEKQPSASEAMDPGKKIFSLFFYAFYQ